MTQKFCWANTNNFDESNIVLVGIPDESHSYALREGTSEAPYRIREISNIRDSYSRKGKVTLGLPFSESTRNIKVFDYGNIDRVQIDEVYGKIITQSKIPITLGGDHSITRQILKSISNHVGKISLVYFDAHPDLISSTTNYYGSIFYDSLPHIKIDSSLQVGIRTPEQEELDNIKKYDLKVITPFDIKERGVKEIANSIQQTCGSNIYVSFDMDCIDPAFAPGVSVPVPMGLSNVEAIYLLKSVVKLGIVGLDIMEVCPSYDIKDRTSHLASRMISEVISSCRLGGGPTGENI